MCMSQQNYEEKYTDPQLRERLKEEIKESDKGGEPGQWSARKSQLLVQEYEKQGGGYKNDEKDEDAKSLERWSDEEWQTREGDTDARQDDGSTKRYLPKEAWDRMSEQEKEETERKKREGSLDGKQYVPNTEAAQSARREARDRSGDEADHRPYDQRTRRELYDLAKERQIDGRSTMTKSELIEALRESR